MTTFDGDTPSGETVDVIETTEADEAAAPEAEVSLEAEEAAPTSDEIEQATPDADEADEAAETAPTADEAAVETDEAAPEAEAAVETNDAAPEAEGEAEEEDPAVALKKELRLKPGEWYVIHSYAGYENKVKANLETRVQNLDVGDYIFQVEVPTEEVTEIKNGQRKQVNRKVLPGYILVRMELNDESWGAVRNTPGVTGFVGATSRPSPLTLDDVVKFLLPQGQPKKAAKSTSWCCGLRGLVGASGDPGRLRGRRVGHRHGRPVRDVARLDQRGQRRTTEAQGAGVHLRPRNTGRTDLQPGRQDLRR